MKKQEDIARTPEDASLRPRNTLIQEKVMVVDGEKIVISSEDYIKRDGRWVKQEIIYGSRADDGRELPRSDFLGKSWTGKKIPKDRHGECEDPFGLHENEIRPLYLGIDGKRTELGHYLCSECLEYQKKRLKWKRCLPLIYNPEIY